MLKKIVPHLCIILSVMILVLSIIDRINHAMNFICNDLFKILLLIFCVAAIVTSVFLIAENRRRNR